MKWIIIPIILSILSIIGLNRIWYNPAMMIRTFVAIELLEQAIAGLTQLQSRLKTLTPPHSVRWTAPQNIHLTLHFLGDIAAEDTAKVSDALAEVAASAGPFSLRLGGLGCFPNTQRPRVLWVGMLEQSPPLAALVQKLGVSLQTAIGFTPEKRPYSPHLTLGRVKNGIQPRSLRQLGETIVQFQKQVGQVARVDAFEISFIQSELRPAGSVYTPLSRHRLGPG